MKISKILLHFIVVGMTLAKGVPNADAQSTGNLCVTVRNVNGSTVSSARVVRYPGNVSVNTPNCFNNIPTGSYTCEAYYTGTFLGEEYWGDGGPVHVNSGQTTNLTINRIYPYIKSVIFRNHSTGGIINPTDQIAPGTTVRAEVVVRNKVSVSLNARVRMILGRSQSLVYDSDQTSSSQSIPSNSTRTFTLTYAPTQTGTWFRAFTVITTLLNGNTPVTDAWSWAQVFSVQSPTGNLCVTVRNAGGAIISGVPVVRYDPSGGTTQGFTGSDGRICWNNIATGSYSVEAYYTGTFFGEEYWGDASGTVNSGQTTNLSVNRIYPYAEGITIRNHSTGTIINPSDQIDLGTTIRAEIVVRNEVSVSLSARVRLLLDRNQASSYDSDQSSALLSIGSSSTRTYSLTYTPANTGTWYRAFSVSTTLLNGNTTMTDAWPWEQAFVLYNVSLTTVAFSSERIHKGETVSASIELYNENPANLNSIHLSIDFLNPNSNFVGSYESSEFDIPGSSSYSVNAMSIWQVPSNAVSGAYQTRVRVHNSSHVTLSEFISGQHPAISLLAIGDFPVLKNVIVRSQEHFSISDANTVQSVLNEFSIRGLTSISLSVKLDDGPGIWSALSPVPGQVLYSSATATNKAQNPLSYDLYMQAQAAGTIIDMSINPWVPTFFDHAQSRYDHPEWKLLNDPPSAPNQDFVDPYIDPVREYEHGLIAEVTGAPNTAPTRLTLDHFRFTNGQHGSDGIASITAFVQAVKSALPPSTELAGYIWLPSDTWWSGQDYSQLNAYLDVFSPMLYWQTRQINSTDDIALVAGQYIRSKVSEIRSVLGSTTTEQKVMPTVSITTSVDYEDGGNYNLNFYEWKSAQLNVLGAIADEGLKGYDLFFHGNWLWNVYPQAPNLGRWVDWAQYFSNLSVKVGDLQGNINPSEVIDAGAQWRVDNGIWHNSGYTQTDLMVGSHEVEFSPIADWTTPERLAVTINQNQLTTVTGTYILITSIEEPQSGQIPSAFDLAQNYPNPFNPETRIQYDVPKATHVTIEIFNLLGHKIRTLVDEQKVSGSHMIVWDGMKDNGDKAASGVYLYSLKAEGFEKSRKLLLLK